MWAGSARGHSSIQRGAEYLVLFGGVPLAVSYRVSPSLWLPLLLAAAAGAAWWLRCRGGCRPRDFWYPANAAEERRHLRRILTRFAIGAPALLLGTALFYPELLFYLPRYRPKLWALIMCLYPLLSVYPQELLYRAFFRQRFGAVFRSAPAFLTANAIAFGWLHIIFQHPLAVILTVLGGFLFADTYRRTCSLRLVCLEHALYGDLLFTIGLGAFFYHGRVQ